MWGRFAAQLPPEFTRQLFATKGELPNLGSNWNVARAQPAMVIRRHPETAERRLDVLRWGLVPHFTKELKACKRPINARSETAGTSGMFRGALAARRCLVPADAFYESKAMVDGKQPYAIAKADGALLAFADPWEGWTDPAGETLRTFTILTTAANDDMARLHGRMPVILDPRPGRCGWGEEPGDHLVLMRPAENDVVRLWPVSPRGQQRSEQWGRAAGLACCSRPAKRGNNPALRSVLRASVQPLSNAEGQQAGHKKP